MKVDIYIYNQIVILKIYQFWMDYWEKYQLLRNSACSKTFKNSMKKFKTELLERGYTY